MFWTSSASANNTDQMTAAAIEQSTHSVHSKLMIKIKTILLQVICYHGLLFAFLSM